MKKESAIRDIGLRIKCRREELHMSQQELATRVGYKSRSSINKIELGKNDIPQSAIQKIANALDCTPGLLMGWEPSKEERLQRTDVEMERKDPLRALLSSSHIVGHDIYDMDADDMSVDDLHAYLKDFVAYGDKEAKQIMISLFQALQSVAKDYSDEDLAGLIKLGKKVLATPPEMFETVSTVVNAILK